MVADLIFVALFGSDLIFFVFVHENDEGLFIFMLGFSLIFLCLVLVFFVLVVDVCFCGGSWI